MNRWPRAQHEKSPGSLPRLGDPAGARTQDPYIKSVMLYQLSYRIRSVFRKRCTDFEGANVTNPTGPKNYVPFFPMIGSRSKGLVRSNK